MPAPTISLITAGTTSTSSTGFHSTAAMVAISCASWPKVSATATDAMRNRLWYITDRALLGVAITTTRPAITVAQTTSDEYPSSSTYPTASAYPSRPSTARNAMNAVVT